MVNIVKTIYTADFETTTKLDDCRVWSYGTCSVDSVRKFEYGNNITDFMIWLEKIKSTVYFHNLKFDGQFIVDWLLKNGFKHSRTGEANTFNTVITKDNSWYIIEIVYARKGRRKIKSIIYDSIKKLPFSVEKIAKDFQLPILKGKIDYHKERPIGYEMDSNELAYLKNDVEIMSRALEIQFNQGLKKQTIGSDAMSSFKDTVKSNFDYLFPKLAFEVDANIRETYKGGFTWVNPRIKNKELKEGIVFDVNSLYPSVMYSNPLPIGDPLFFKGKYKEDKIYPLYTQKISCEYKIKKNKVPTIQKTKSSRFMVSDYSTESDGEETLNLTSIDLKLFMDNYDVYNIEYLGGWKFQSQTGIFKEYIDYWSDIKKNSEGAIRELAKLMLNSLYGKFGTNPEKTKKIPYLDSNGVVQLKLDKLEFDDAVYIPMASFITAYAREITIRTATKCYDRICYCDTDSIHLEGTEIPNSIKDDVHPVDLGKWKHESTFTRAKFIRPKRYIEEIEGELNIKCSGMPYSITKTMKWEDFKIGYVTRERKVPKKVSGGIVLVNGIFELKP